MMSDTTTISLSNYSSEIANIEKEKLKEAITEFNESVDLQNLSPDANSYKLHERNILTFVEQAKSLEHESIHDHLTGSFNRRQLDRTLSENWQQPSDQTNPNHLVMLDIDDFKHVNDNYSHEIGDKVLQIISSIIKNNLNENDRLFRYGGEEFTIYLNNIRSSEASHMFEKIRSDIEQNDWNIIAKELKITATLGMVTNTEQQDINSALQMADERMYKGKKLGKNILVED